MYVLYLENTVHTPVVGRSRFEKERGGSMRRKWKYGVLHMDMRKRILWRWKQSIVPI